MAGDPDPRAGYQRRQPLRTPDDWVPAPHHARPGSMGPPKTDDVPWWRLQPGRVEDGRLVTPSIVHGGTCVDWAWGRAPANWTYHSRTETRRLLGRPAEVVACPKCSPRIGL